MDRAGGIKRMIVVLAVLVAAAVWATWQASRVLNALLTAALNNFSSFGRTRGEILSEEAVWQSFGMPMWCIGLAFVVALVLIATVFTMLNERWERSQEKTFYHDFELLQRLGLVRSVGSWRHNFL